MQMKRILVAIDRTTITQDTDSAALEIAVSLADKYGGELKAITVIDDPLVEAEKHVYPIGDDDVIERNEAQARLDRLIKKTLKKLGLQQSVPSLVMNGKRENIIMKVVQQEDIDLLVVGHRPELPIEHMLFGRTLDHIVAKSSCAVLVVPEVIPEADIE
jgi:nucleotide-binding universal stress UspA family protein